jgi:hypothetical protein
MLRDDQRQACQLLQSDEHTRNALQGAGAARLVAGKSPRTGLSFTELQAGMKNLGRSKIRPESVELRIATAKMSRGCGRQTALGSTDHP